VRRSLGDARPPRAGFLQPVRLTRRRAYCLGVKTLAAGVLIALLLPASAVARTRTVAPPGNSGVSQYLETIPTAKGGRPTGTIHQGTGGSGTLSPAIQRAFARQGAAGRSAAALANATVPVSAHSQSGRSTGARAVASQPPAASSGSGGSPASSLAKALTGSSGGGGLGTLLPVILVVCAIGGGVLALLRRRRAT